MDVVARLLEEIDQLSAADRARVRIALGAVDGLHADELGRDPLTGVLDADGFRTASSAVTARADRTGERLQVVRVDLDRFEGYNVTNGPEAGDAALRAMANALRQVFRAGDVIGRLGPDDFVVLCSGTGSAAMFQSRIEAAFQAATVGLPVITASVAVVRASSHMTLDSMLASADSAVLRAMVDAAYRRVGR